MRIKALWPYLFGITIVIILLLTFFPLSCGAPGGGGGGSFDSEGSPGAPIVIDPNTSHSGQVGTDRSYYKTYGVSDYQVTVYLEELTDDADIIDFKTDGTFSSEPLPDTDDYFAERGRGRSGDYPYFGRTMPEVINEAGPVSAMYFVVDGRYTPEGASYNLRVESSDPPARVTPNSHGSASSPELFPLGVMTPTSVGALVPSYYKIISTPGKSYLASTDGVNITIFTEPGFSDPKDDSGLNVGPVPATGDHVYIEAEATSAFFKMEVVTSEGNLSAPIELYEDKGNFCQIDIGSSFYRFGVSPGQSYTVKLIPNPKSYNVSFEAFDSGNFSSSAGTAADNYPDPETLSFTPTGNQITVRVDDTDGNGATFILRAFQN